MSARPKGEHRPPPVADPPSAYLPRATAGDLARLSRVEGSSVLVTYRRRLVAMARRMERDGIIPPDAGRLLGTAADIIDHAAAITLSGRAADPGAP